MKHRPILVGLVIVIGLGCSGLLLGVMVHQAQAMDFQGFRTHNSMQDFHSAGLNSMMKTFLLMYR